MHVRDNCNDIINATFALHRYRNKIAGILTRESLGAS